MRSFQPAEPVRKRRRDVSDFYASSYRESPASFAMFTRLVVLLVIALGFVPAAQLLVGMPR